MEMKLGEGASCASPSPSGRRCRPTFSLIQSAGLKPAASMHGEDACWSKVRAQQAVVLVGARTQAVQVSFHLEGTFATRASARRRPKRLQANALGGAYYRGAGEGEGLRDDGGMDGLLQEECALGARFANDRGRGHASQLPLSHATSVEPATFGSPINM